MTKTICTLGVLAAAAMLLNCTQRKAEAGDPAPVSTVATQPVYGGYQTQAAWGQHLMAIGACGDCHTPKKMSPQGPVEDSALLFSGHPAQLPPPQINRSEVQQKGLGVTETLTAWVGPWGISFAANLTPHETGTGNWTEDQFLYAIRNGKLKGLPTSRPLLPPMPWPAYRHMTDDELKAIFAYLRTVKPIDNRVPPPTPPVAMK